MTKSNAASSNLETKFERLAAARTIIRQECDALEKLQKSMPADFDDVVQLLLSCRGCVIVTGMGKAGWVGQKISATLASTGTPSHFLHPGEAMHGDLGRIRAEDIVLVLSNSGETAEILQLLPALEKNQIRFVALTASEQCTLAKSADFVLNYGVNREACSLGLAPSTSATVMMALGDALSLTVSQARQFLPTDFAKFHPGGSLGLKLSTVDEVMRPLKDCRLASDEETIRQVYTRLSGPHRRSGAILLLNQSGELSGIFTDSDLARLLEMSKDDLFDGPINQVMTAEPIQIESGSRTSLALELLAKHNISELPVVNSSGKPIGLIDVTDLVAI